MNSKQSCLRNWLKNNGIEKVAKKLGVAESTVRRWRTGRHLPKTEHLHLLCKMSRGALTPDVIISEFVKGQR